jgi:hypothetical protein
MHRGADRVFGKRGFDGVLGLFDAGCLGQLGRRFGPGRQLVDVAWLAGGCV